jgi:hypothetical protein
MEKQKMFQTTYQMNACGPLLYLSPLNLSPKKNPQHQHPPPNLQSMDWFKGKSTGNHRFSHEI